MQRVTVITDDLVEVEGRRDDDRLLVPVDTLEDATGWHLEDRGLCRDEVCVPVRDRDALLGGGFVDLGCMGEVIGHPTVADADEGVVAMAAPAAQRAVSLESLDAPRLTLDDLDGRPLDLPGAPGKKKLLVAWASW